MALTKSEFNELVAMEKRQKAGKTVNARRWVTLRAKASDTEYQLASLKAHKRRLKKVL